MSVIEGIRLYFSDFFNINEDVIEEYGALNISLINDLPLFVDPFLIFNNDNPKYKELHVGIVKYILFLKEQAACFPEATLAMLKAWYLFSEVKQTWLGFSLSGNDGRGLGNDFAKNLHYSLTSIFKDFGSESITQSPHLEKLCLISPLVGKDKISDFTVNLIKNYILEYTETFAKESLSKDLCENFYVPKVIFNYTTGVWQSKSFYLPFFNGDYVLLTPKDILTRDETFINKDDMVKNLHGIAVAVDDDVLRFQLNNYFRAILDEKEKLTKLEKESAALSLISKHPEIIDYYIRYKENTGQEAVSYSKQVVEEVQRLFNVQLQSLVKILKDNTDFYSEYNDSYSEAMKRVKYLKGVIENNDGYRFFFVDGIPIKRESDLQIMYRLVWYASSFDVNREVNNGRGPVDYKISKGSKDSTLVEFKLASNSKLKQNLAKQVEIYKEANYTDKAIKVILYFTETELLKVTNILKELKLNDQKSIVLIDARNDNKESASNVKI